MNFRTRPHFEDRQIVQYLDENITLSGITNIAPIVLNFSGTTTAETAVTISELTGYLNGGKLSGFVVKPPTLLQSGTTATTTTNVENFVLKSLDQYGSVGWAPISGISWSVSACTSPLNVTNIVPCTPGGTIYFNAGNLEINNTVRINDGSQVNGYVFTSDGSGNGSWLPPVDNYTTGATLNGTVIEFDRTDLSNAYNVDIKPALLDYLPLRITGNTVVSVDDNVDLYFSGFTGSSIINYVNYGDSLEYINGTVISKDYATLFNRRVTNLETFSIYAIQSKGIALDYSDSGGTVNEFYVNKSAMLANSTIPTFQGIKYGSDYSPNYTNRSLVDKEYVDNLVSSTIFTGNTSASCITDLWVSNIHGCSPITIWDSVQSIGSLATGTTSFALGIGNLASGIASFAEGGNTTANGPASHSEGSGTLADGDASHAEGYQTIALGDYSHVEGWQTLASGNFGSHAEGFLTIASGTTSHSEGRSTVAGGSNSHAEGNSTKAYGSDSHSEGSNTIAIGTGSHAGGDNSIASGNTSFIHSTNSLVTGNRSAILGGQNITGTTDDTVYVPYLNISNLSVGVPINNLGIDSSGNVVVGTSGSGSTTGIFSGITILNITTGTSVSILGITSGGTIVDGSDLYGDICSYCSDVVSGDTFISTGITETNIINVDSSTIGSNSPYTCTLWCYYKGGTLINSTINYEEALKYESLGYVIRCCDGNSADGGTNFGASISGETTTSGNTSPTTITGLTRPYTVNRTKKIAFLNTHESDVLSSNQVAISNSTLGRVELSTLSSIDSSFNSKIYNSYLSSVIGSENGFITGSGNSLILGSQYSTLSGVTGSTIIGGNNIVGTSNDTVYVTKLNIKTLGGGTAINNLGIDSGGNIVTGTAGGGIPAATTATTTTINFSGQTIYYNAGTPGTGNITGDLTGSKLGLIQKIYHNDVAEPTYPAGWVLMGDAIYFTSTLNIIYAEWAGGTRVEYWYVQEQ
jgi:hypothetical protein